MVLSTWSNKIFDQLKTKQETDCVPNINPVRQLVLYHLQFTVTAALIFTQIAAVAINPRALVRHQCSQYLVQHYFIIGLSSFGKMNGLIPAGASTTVI